MSQDLLKLSVARAAISYVPKGTIIGVGSGSTALFFVDELGKIKDEIKGAVASSEATATRLRHHNIRVFDLNDVASVPVYVDGADEITLEGVMIKGGGGALTREKIIAAAADRFICIADESKLVPVLGSFPLPVEVIPMAHLLVGRKLIALGGEPELRMNQGKPYQTDNGNFILDIRQLKIIDPVVMESEINNIPGVVTTGIFAQRRANICLLGTANGVGTLAF
jgi:ribose 5-phosphate isomerase A